MSDDGRGEHVFLTRAGRLGDVFLTRSIHSDVLQQKPSDPLLQDTKRLLALEKTYLIELNRRGGIVDQIVTDLKMLHSRMDLYALSTPSTQLDATWVSGLAHLKTLETRVVELRDIPLDAVSCHSCGGLYPPVPECEHLTHKLCAACYCDQKNTTDILAIPPLPNTFGAQAAISTRADKHHTPGLTCYSPLQQPMTLKGKVLHSPPALLRSMHSKSSSLKPSARSPRKRQRNIRPCFM